MATAVVIFKILFLVLIAHSCCWFVASSPAAPAEAHQQQAADHEKQPAARRHLAEQGPDFDGVPRLDSSSVQQKFILPPPPPPPPPTTLSSESLGPSLETAATVSGGGDHDETHHRAPLITSASAETTTTAAAAASEFHLPVTSREQAGDSAGRRSEQVNYAELCYLSNGGSSLTLTVNEASPVGFVIGTIEVNGDPALEGGNVDLFDDVGPADSSAAAATPSATSRQANHSQAAAAAAAAGEQQASSSSVSQQARHVAQRLQRLLGKRSTIGFRDQPIVSISSSSAAPTTDQTTARQSGQQLVIGSSWDSPKRLAANNNNNNLWSSIGGGSPPGEAAQQSAAAAGVGPAATPPQLPPAVRLEPGTRNLILVRQLDKESAEGEQSLLVNVRCSPRKTTGAGAGAGQETTTIPVRVIVTDANDHAPEFQNAGRPFVVNISETTPVETVVLRDIEAIDRDSAGPFSTVHYRVLEEPGLAHSGWLQFVNPLVPHLMVARQLDYETQSSFQLTIVAQDEGEPEPLWASAQVQVNIIDFDDQNPRFLDEKYTLLMDETQQNLVGQNLQILPRNLYAEDGDRGIAAPILYSFDQQSTWTAADNQQQQSFNVNHYLHLNPGSGEIRLLRQWPALGGQQRAAGLFGGGGGGAQMTLVVRATQADNKDRYTLTTLTVTTTGTLRSSSSLPYHHLSGNNNQPASSVSATTANETHGGGGAKQQGIEFEQSQLSVRVPESAPVNEKIARVRARYIQAAAAAASLQLATDESLQPVDVLSGANSGAAEQAGKKQPASTRGRQLQATGAEQRRPINYQILDDQTDQFGINGLGEIFIKRQLDYEHKQEFRFRVLATYLKHSDICRVHVEVLNVNDNKPKFTQPQYTFHITESRLRGSNLLLGQVQAHDADLNDTMRYSLSGEHSHLFNIHPQTGQVSLRSNIKQLNITSCQLIVIATDSLGSSSSPSPSPSGGHHQQQFTHQARLNLQIAPQLVGRSINFAPDAAATATGSGGDDERAGKVFSSRSLSESSTQSQESWLLPAGTAKQTNGRPHNPRDGASSQRSSVATVMASVQHMVKSVNFFDMPMSSALLLSALLAFLICLLFILLVSMSVHVYRRQVNKSLGRSRRRLHHQQQHLAATAHIRHAHLAATNQLLSAAAPQPAPPGGALSRYLQQSPATSARSTNSTSTTQASGSAQSSPHQQQQQQPDSGAGGPKTMTRPLVPKLTAKVSPASVVIGGTSATRPASALSLASRRSQQRQQQHPMGPVSLEPLETLSAQLQQRRAAAAAAGGFSSMVSSSHSSFEGRRSKHSYRSTESSGSVDDGSSSVMHCGHYSVNGGSASYDTQMKNSLKRGQENCQPQSVKSTTDQPEESHKNDVNDDHDGSPGIKSYRKLPANLGSLARPQVAKFPVTAAAVAAQDSAIASDESASSSSSSSSSRDKQMDCGDQLVLRHQEPDIRVPSPPLCRTGNLIRWPLGSMPQRVKKLTWDDELSQQSNNFDGDDDRASECYMSPDYARSVITNNADNQQRAALDDEQPEARMMFSPNPCSPTSHHSIVVGGQLDSSSSMIGQNNCFDYTIVESSQFQVQDTHHLPLSLVNQQTPPSLSAQHHYLQQQQHLINTTTSSRLPPLTKTTSYLYSSNGSFQDSKRTPTSISNNQQQQQHQPKPNNLQDLITTAVL